MGEKHDILKEQGMIDPPAELASRVISHIRTQKQRRARRLLFVYSGVCMFSIGLLAWGVRMFALEFTASGLAYYMALAVSDGVIVQAFWKDFVLSLLEALPLVSLVVLFSGLFSFLASLKGIIKHKTVIYGI